MEKLERINKYLSEAGVCSRREVDQLIRDERIDVNGQPARIGMVIDTERDEVRVDGEVVDPAHPERNAISIAALEAAQQRPWWVEHNRQKEERDQLKRQNPKSRLLRKGKKNAGLKPTSIKKLSGKAPLTPAQKREREERRAQNRAAKTFSEALSDKQALMNVKVRRVDNPVNAKSAALRGKTPRRPRRR